MSSKPVVSRYLSILSEGSICNRRIGNPRCLCHPSRVNVAYHETFFGKGDVSVTITSGGE